MEKELKLAKIGQDWQIILSHFSGNYLGKLTASGIPRKTKFPLISISRALNNFGEGK